MRFVTDREYTYVCVGSKICRTLRVCVCVCVFMQICSVDLCASLCTHAIRVFMVRRILWFAQTCAQNPVVCACLRVGNLSSVCVYSWRCRARREQIYARMCWTWTRMWNWNFDDLSFNEDIAGNYWREDYVKKSKQWFAF